MAVLTSAGSATLSGRAPTPVVSSVRGIAAVTLDTGRLGEQATPSVSADSFYAGVMSVQSDRSGGRYLAGGFTSVQGVAKPYLAHVLASGQVDPTWPADAPDRPVATILRDGGTLFVSGASDHLESVASGLDRNCRRFSATGMRNMPGPLGRS